MIKLDRNLSDVFGLQPMLPSQTTIIDQDMNVSVPSESDSANIDHDAESARTNMHGLIEIGKDALQYALDVAKESESPRAFEVVATMLKTISDLNMQLLDTHEKKSKLKGVTKREATAPEKIVNNSIVFNGSTSELNKMISEMKRSQ